MNDVTMLGLKSALDPLLQQLREYLAKHGGSLEPTIRKVWDELLEVFSGLDLDGERAQRLAVYEACARALSPRTGLDEARCLGAVQALLGEEPRKGGAATPDAEALEKLRAALVTLKVVYRRGEQGGDATRLVEVWSPAGQGAAKSVIEERVGWEDVLSDARAHWIRTGARECTFTVYPKES
ncbi:MAG TPA: hypothetical protein VFE30_12600 [Anaeromyxobacteraceae bacterium]|jgi:hypothetical protein|nr:hypothetical protein [Anaeromyxobacteraceae bacterium]